MEGRKEGREEGRERRVSQWERQKRTGRKDQHGQTRGNCPRGPVAINTRRALAEYPEVARVDSARDQEGRERPQCLPAILSWNQF